MLTAVGRIEKGYDLKLFRCERNVYTLLQTRHESGELGNEL